MNIRRHTLSTLLLGAASLSLLPIGTAHAQTATATTDPVGYTTASLLANSDSLVSIPFTRPAAYTGAIASISGNTITLAGTPGFTASQYVYAAGTQSNTYYAIIGPMLTSLTGTVSVTNGSTAVTGSGFTAIAAGDELIVNGLAYNVASVASDSALTLSRAFTGTTATGQTASYDHSPKEGSYYTVTANGTGTLTVNLNGDSLSAVAASTSVSLIPYWTLGTAFPDSAAGTSYIASSGTTSRTRQTQIFTTDLTSAGINLVQSATYFYYNAAWRLAGSADPTVSYDDIVLPPSTYFTVRNASTATTFTPTGGVYMNRLTIPLDTQSSQQQDNAVAIARPAPVALNDLGLITSGAFAASTGTTTRTRTDSLQVYDNTQIAFNKVPSANYFYYNGGWRLAGATDPTVDYGTTTLPYGTGVIIRKAATPGGTTAFWQNVRNY